MGKIVDADELYSAFLSDPMGGLNYDLILREAKPVDAVQVIRKGGAMDDIKVRVIDSNKLIEAINTGSYDINLSAVMALGAVVVGKEISKKPFENGNIEEFKKNLLRTINTGIVATNTKDDYSRGIRNGMRWCRSLLDDEEPQYEGEEDES